MSQNKEKKFTFVMIVWGEEYTDFFLTISLPSLLSEKNIPLCSLQFSLEMAIYTSKRDAKTIAGHPSFLKLQEFIKAVLIEEEIFSQTHDLNKYSLRGVCLSQAIRKAIAQPNTVLLLGSPDVIWGNGSLIKCCDLIAAGYDVVNVTALNRVVLESISPILKLQFLASNPFALTLSHRELIALGLEHLHRIGKGAFWNAKLFTPWPSFIYWKLGTHSLLAKFFHVQPLAVHFHKVKKEIPDQLMPDDGGLIEWLEIPQNKIHMVTSSDEIALLEVSKKDLNQEQIHLPVRFKSFFIFKWALKCTLPEHRAIFSKHTIAFLGEALPKHLVRTRGIIFLKTIFLQFLLLTLKLRPSFILKSLWRKVFSNYLFFQRRKKIFLEIFKKFQLFSDT